MRIVHRTPSAERIVEIDIDDPSRSVGDLLVALGCARAAAEVDVVIDGVPVAADRPLSAVTVCEGSVVDTTADPAATREPGCHSLVVVGGVRAGGRVDADETVTVGRAADVAVRIADPAMSPLHLSVSAAGLRDHGSRNGTSIEGHPVCGSVRLPLDATVRAGATRLALRRATDDRPVAVVSALGALGGTIPFNRPPRPRPAPDLAPLVVPAAAPEPPATEPISVAGIVLPIIAGAVVAVLFSPFMAVFAALGPVLTIGTWWERRRRARRTHRAAVRRLADDLARLALELPGHRTAEIARRRARHPDPAEVVRRASGPSVRCWERRPGDADAFAVGLGTDDEPFRPRLLPAGGDRVAPEAAVLVAAQPLMPDVPVTLELSPGRVVGVVGDRAVARAVVRSLVVQMATHHGPADLAIAVGADDPGVWAWCRWLPHTSDHAAGRRGANVVATTDVAGADAVVERGGNRLVLAVLDGDDPLQGRATAGRRFLGSAATAALVVVPDSDRLPATCDTVVTADELGRMRVVDPRRAGAGRTALGWGLDTAVAEGAARRMARLDDPELPIAGAGVPAAVSMLGLLALGGDDPGEIEQRWVRTDGTADLAVPIGADGEGAVVLDFVADGPHVLVGGTTGSGKSELLRSLVAGLAATADPDHLAMVLVDYKGGAAFDCCADLPHVAGLVTDLDDALAARALRCLDAELRHREHRLRALGAEDLGAHRARAATDRGIEPLPRLVVVVDEFASLAADLPEFLDALVGIAQRGRSLGVHLVLATQRPAGVVTDDIRANAGCRIALRVTDRNDSVDVIGAPDAAAIPRARPGRAVARFGPGELVPFQSALSTGHSRGGAGVSIRGANEGDQGRGPTDLQRLVASVIAAHQARGGRPPRAPWPPQLPDRILRDDLGADDRDAPSWWLVDLPDEQRQVGEGWTLDDGHLVVVGGPGSGATTTLATAALAATRGRGVDAPHVHVIDLDAGGLAPLAGLAAVGTVVGPTDTARRVRLVRWLDDEISRRRGEPAAAGPPILVLVDDYAGLARAHDPIREATLHERFARIWADGPSVGVTVAVSLRRGADLTPDLAATVGTVLLHRSADQSDALRFSLRQSTAGFVPGRAVRSGDGATVQVVIDAPTIAEAVERRRHDALPVPTPHEVGELRAEIGWAEVEPSLRRAHGVTRIEFGLRDRDLRPAALDLHEGEHALVLGPPRSGRTNALAALARVARPHLAVVVVGDGDLARRVGVAPQSPSALDPAVQGRGATLVLVDDCLDVDDPDGCLAALVAAAPPGVHVIAAARADRYRKAYGHWSADIRASRVGLLLRPDPIDGDLLGLQLPARLGLDPVPGRGIAAGDGTMEVVQVVQAGDQSSAG